MGPLGFNVENIIITTERIILNSGMCPQFLQDLQFLSKIVVSLVWRMWSGTILSLAFHLISDCNQADALLASRSVGLGKLQQQDDVWEGHFPWIFHLRTGSLFQSGGHSRKHCDVTCCLHQESWLKAPLSPPFLLHGCTLLSLCQVK